MGDGEFGDDIGGGSFWMLEFIKGENADRTCDPAEFVRA
jgi:hypothetical protein